MASIPNRCEYAGTLCKTLGEESSFLSSEYSLSAESFLTERQQQKQVFQTPGNHPTLKAASGKAQRALESLARLASLQTQKETKIMVQGDSLHYFCIRMPFK